MKEFKFVMNPDDDSEVVVTSHWHDEVEADIENAGKALQEFVNANCRDTFESIMYVPCEFHFDDAGNAIYTGPDADHPFYNSERFVEEMEKFNAGTLDQRGAENPDEAWINIGGTFCCGPTWKENPHYTGIPTAHPDSAVH